MKKNRRDFIRKSTAMAALSFAGINPAVNELLNNSKKELRKNNTGYIPDAGIKLCFAYFRGIEAEKRKIEFGKQLNVLGAVGGINPQMAGLNNVRAWDYEAVMAVKKAWENPGYSALGSLYAAGYIRGLIEAIAKNG